MLHRESFAMLPYSAWPKVETEGNNSYTVGQSGTAGRICVKLNARAFYVKPVVNAAGARMDGAGGVVVTWKGDAAGAFATACSHAGILPGILGQCA
jgi:hypothetical protein